MQDFLKVSSWWMEDLRKSKRLPDQTACGLKLGQEFPRNKKKNYIAECVWKKVPKLQAARRNKGTYEVFTNVKDHIKGSAHARVVLEKDTALA